MFLLALENTRAKCKQSVADVQETATLNRCLQKCDECLLDKL